jgi:AcrR family transcriptional regulator
MMRNIKPSDQKASIVTEMSESYDRKRLEVLEATWRVILRVGLENVTFREIAAEMRATTGTVVHYFRTKDEVLLHALDHLISAMQTNIESQVGRSEGLERLERMVHACLPLDEESELGWRIWLAFLKSSIGSEKLSSEHSRRYLLMRNTLVSELKLLVSQARVRPGLNLVLEADALVALIDGIGVGRVIDATRFTPRQQKLLVKRHLLAFLAPH